MLLSLSDYGIFAAVSPVTGQTGRASQRARLRPEVFYHSELFGTESNHRGSGFSARSLILSDSAASTFSAEDRSARMTEDAHRDRRTRDPTFVAPPPAGPRPGLVSQDGHDVGLRSRGRQKCCDHRRLSSAASTESNPGGALLASEIFSPSSSSKFSDSLPRRLEEHRKRPPPPPAVDRAREGARHW
jgi:hypothetical protein